MNKQNIKILVVEDDKFLRELLSHKLEAAGFSVLLAIDGQEALKIVKEEMPQIVLLDLVLPGIDGFEILKQIKENDQTSKIPVIVLSNLGQKEEIEKGMSLGANDYLIKAHFTPDEIIEKIGKVLGTN